METEIERRGMYVSWVTMWFAEKLEKLLRINENW